MVAASEVRIEPSSDLQRIGYGCLILPADKEVSTGVPAAERDCIQPLRFRELLESTDNGRW